MPRKPNPLSHRFQAIGYAAGVSPYEPDRSAFVQIGPMKLRRDALVRFRREHHELTDEQIIFEVIGVRKPRPGRARGEEK